MRFIIWGAGIWGRRMFQCIKDSSCYDVVAFIDNDENKRKENLFSLPIITYEEYKEKYFDCFLIISVASETGRNKINEKLESDSICNYYWHIECPSEMIFLRNGGIPFDEIVNEAGLDDQELKVAINGNNLFSILLFDYLKLKKYDYVCLIKEQNNIIYDYLAREGYVCENLNSAEKKYDVILHTEDGWIPEATYSAGEARHIEFRTFSFLKRYKNEQIEAFHNRYADKERCFIVASGPSLKMEDLDKLHVNGEYCFSMNRVYLAFQRSCWRPEFYVVGDGKGLIDNRDDFIKLDVKYKFYSDASDEFWIDNKELLDTESNIYKYHETGNFCIDHDPMFSEDLTKGTFLGGSVVYDCLQFAVYMGFKKIYLLGVDCSFKQTGNADDDHFIKGYAITANQGYFYEGLGWQLRAYRAAHQYADAHGVQIYNATRGGALEEFNRVEFDSLF